MNGKQRRIAVKIQSGELKKKEARRLSKKLAKSLHKKGYTAEKISKLINCPPQQAQKLIDEKWNFDFIGECHVKFCIIVIIISLLLSIFFTPWFLLVGGIFMVTCCEFFLD
jgi:IS4 transposase